MTMHIHALTCVFCFVQYSVSQSADEVQPEAGFTYKPYSISSTQTFLILYFLQNTQINLFYLKAQMFTLSHQK